MEETPLYRQIVEEIRQDILQGRLKAGDRMPPIRQMTTRWGCTPGTVQRAYHELAEQGLVSSRAGQGTHVTNSGGLIDDTPLRRAALVHRAQAFLLEVLTAGYSTSEAETAMRLALDQWRALSTQEKPPPLGVLRFAGSHDLALAWIAAHFGEIAEGYSLELQFSGSLGGLIALVEGKADVAGCHLWDAETDCYNTPFVQRLFPGQKVALLGLAQRRLGLMLPAGNPQGIKGLSDLRRAGVRFVNRQAGSGTRVWLDAALRREGIRAEQIEGYEVERLTHSEVARMVAEGEAEASFGLQTAARAFGLEFIPLVSERYDLAIPEARYNTWPVQKLAEWLSSLPARQAIAELGGYDTSSSGRLEWVY